MQKPRRLSLRLTPQGRLKQLFRISRRQGYRLRWFEEPLALCVVVHGPLFSLL
jgi:hypothetical protein